MRIVIVLNQKKYYNFGLSGDDTIKTYSYPIADVMSDVLSDIGACDILVLVDHGSVTLPYLAGYACGRGKLIVRVIDREDFESSDVLYVGAISELEAIASSLITCFSDELATTIQKLIFIVTRHARISTAEHFMLLHSLRESVGPRGLTKVSS